MKKNFITVKWILWFIFEFALNIGLQAQTEVIEDCLESAKEEELSSMKLFLENKALVNQSVSCNKIALADIDKNLEALLFYLEDEAMWRKIILQSIRNGDIRRLQFLNQHKDLQALLASESFYHGKYAACLKADPLDTILLDQVDVSPITVFQSFCDTFVRLKNRSFLSLKGQNAHDVYHYLQQRLKMGDLGQALSSLVLYKNPDFFLGHFFSAIRHQGKESVIGFYLNKDPEGRLEDDKSMEYFIKGVLGAVTLTVFYTLWDLRLASSGVYFDPLKVVTIAFLLASAFTEVIYYYYIAPIMPFIDHRLGLLQYDEEAQKISDENNYPLLSIVITEEQAQRALFYIDKVKKDCDARESYYCTYQIFIRNSLSFVKELLWYSGLSPRFTEFFQ